MEYAELMGTDIRISRIGMGCWGIAGGRTWGERDDRRSIDTLRAAYDRGISFFDTAYSYGNGYSEELVGKALGPLGDRVVIATKVGTELSSPSEVERHCEESLRRLRRDWIDLYQLHWHLPGMPPLPEIIEAMWRLVESGKVRAIGVCNLGKGQLALLPPEIPVVTNQLPYSLLWRAIEYEVMPASLERGMGILAYSPLMQGLLTGKFSSPEEVPEGRARSRHFSSSRPQAIHGEEGAEELTFETIHRLSDLARDLDIPLAHLAIAWVLQREGVASVLVGARTPDQVDANVGALAVRLSEEVLAELDTITTPLKERLGPNPDMWQTSGRIW
ncbi:aldo/keto reductase [Spirochaeta thermophila]|uniref:NADP-dependent oxidoreductase domain-containing protein n=1 Tax=Winmispira thermophila (strain ATCC 49972 / DSM 6192 / RI 19.B1) TaxID=665571 RepID=E0RPT3_WINT6|nr:aldo/keto reductase [Spirochaeta thermophila]ADN01397.1 hypothetical protein STHERM_c04250 [Spirochaeta thermophila DSM 6192]